MWSKAIGVDSTASWWFTHNYPLHNFHPAPNWQWNPAPVPSTQLSPSDKSTYSEHIRCPGEHQVATKSMLSKEKNKTKYWDYVLTETETNVWLTSFQFATTCMWRCLCRCDLRCRLNMSGSIRHLNRIRDISLKTNWLTNVAGVWIMPYTV